MILLIKILSLIKFTLFLNYLIKHIFYYLSQFFNYLLNYLISAKKLFHAKKQTFNIYKME